MLLLLCVSSMGNNLIFRVRCGLAVGESIVKGNGILKNKVNYKFESSISNVKSLKYTQK